MSETIEVADIVRRYGNAYLEQHGYHTDWHQRRAMLDITRCRTAAMGGHVEVCTNCGTLRNAYNSCRNRHCPKCMGSARLRWSLAREAELLPVPYFHVVFTIPRTLAPLALVNPRVVYGLLLKAAGQTLTEVAADPKHLGARVGCLAVLHTWGQKLNHHPHVHCVVPGGGLSPDGQRWIPAARTDFFVHVKVLGIVFRAKLLDMLFRAFVRGHLAFPGTLARWQRRRAFKRLLARAKSQDWVRYLARYTHRVAIANHRIVGLKNDRVIFRYKDYADGHAVKTMSLPAVEFIRRFLTHILPPGFTRIRYYGFLANHDRAHHIELCRQLIAEADIPPAPVADRVPDGLTDEPDRVDPERCPACHVGRMAVLRVYPRPHLQPKILAQPVLVWDSS
jgi:hypothetical protein